MADEKKSISAGWLDGITDKAISAGLILLNGFVTANFFSLIANIEVDGLLPFWYWLFNCVYLGAPLTIFIFYVRAQYKKNKLKFEETIPFLKNSLIYFWCFLILLSWASFNFLLPGSGFYTKAFKYQYILTDYNGIKKNMETRQRILDIEHELISSINKTKSFIKEVQTNNGKTDTNTIKTYNREYVKQTIHNIELIKKINSYKHRDVKLMDKWTSDTINPYFIDSIYAFDIHALTILRTVGFSKNPELPDSNYLNNYLELELAVGQDSLYYSYLAPTKSLYKEMTQNAEWAFRKIIKATKIFSFILLIITAIILFEFYKKLSQQSFFRKIKEAFTIVTAIYILLAVQLTNKTDLQNIDFSETGWIFQLPSWNTPNLVNEVTGNDKLEVGTAKEFFETKFMPDSLSFVLEEINTLNKKTDKLNVSIENLSTIVKGNSKSIKPYDDSNIRRELDSLKSINESIKKILKGQE